MSYKTINGLSEAQARELCVLFQEEWWTQGRLLSDVKKMLTHSDIIIGFVDTQTKRLIAFARVLTDYVYRAALFDVIVHKDYRGEGLGRALMQEVMNHPDIRKVQFLDLVCSDELVPFYQKWAFTDKFEKVRLMRKAR